MVAAIPQYSYAWAQSYICEYFLLFRTSVCLSVFPDWSQTSSHSYCRRFVITPCPVLPHKSLCQVLHVFQVLKMRGLFKIKLSKLSQVGRRENCYLKLTDNVAALWASLNRKQQGEIREHRCVVCYVAMKVLCDMRIENSFGKGEYI